MESYLDEFGREIIDHTPVSYPINFEKPIPLHKRIRAMILEALHETGDDETETLEEANDFDMPEEPELWSPYEEEENYDMLETGAGAAAPVKASAASGGEQASNQTSNEEQS